MEARLDRRGYRSLMRRRDKFLDAAVALTLLVGGAAQLLSATDRSAPLGVDLTLALAVTLPLVVRRRWPAVTFGLVMVATLAAAAVEDAGADLLFMPPLLIACYTAGAYLPLRTALVVPAGLGVMFGVGFAAGAIPAGDVPVGVAFFGGACLTGQLLQARDRHIAEFAARAVRAEEQLERDRLAAVTAERARIARELHDIISHSISVITIQTQAVRRRLRADQLAETADLARVEATARQAMVEMRRMLGVLRSGSEPASLLPQPGMDQLGRLVEETRRAGIDVHLVVTGAVYALAPGIDLTAYRIVQEALTNVRKHAPGARVTLTLDYGMHDLSIDVADDGGCRVKRSVNNAGQGVIGMKERVALYDGVLEAGPEADGGYTLRARLPVAASEAS